jgi:hypothetical protein
MRFWRDQIVVAALCFATLILIVLTDSWPFDSEESGHTGRSLLPWNLFNVGFGAFFSRLFSRAFLSPQRVTKVREEIEILFTVIPAFKRLALWFFALDDRSRGSSA